MAMIGTLTMTFSPSHPGRKGASSQPQGIPEAGDGLSCEQLQQLAQATTLAGPLLIDVRPRRSFRRGHLNGSHHIPAARLVSSEPPEGDLILISETADQAQRLIDALHSGGYPRRIRYLQEGFRGWQQRRLPIATETRHRADRGIGWRTASQSGVLAISGLLLILSGSLSGSLPLLALGVLLLASPWIEAGFETRAASRRLELDG